MEMPGNAAEGSALSLRKVTKAYSGHVAVRELSFEVPRGSIFGFLGPNGAGKTTSLRMINDIIAPDAGEIAILDGLKPGRAAAARIGYLPEERGLYPKMKVLELLRFFGELRGLSGREARRRGLSWLERLDIADWAANKVQDLSKGMQQKVQFAASLLHEPELLILDEPWSGLDPINAEVLREVVLEIRAAGRTVVFSTHLMEQAEKICDHVCIIARGRKVLDGALTQLKRDEAVDSSVVVRLGDGAATDAAAAAVFGDASLVGRHQPAGGSHELELASGVSPDALLAALVAAKVTVRRFEVREPTLHQMFVDRVKAANLDTHEQGHAGGAGAVNA